jgi:hypothetical protein
MLPVVIRGDSNSIGFEWHDKMSYVHRYERTYFFTMYFKCNILMYTSEYIFRNLHIK